jgi:hypothetical protein
VTPRHLSLDTDFHLAPSQIYFALGDSIVPTFHLPAETDELCPILEAIEALTPGGLSGLLLNGGGLPNLLKKPGVSKIPNIHKLTNIHDKYRNMTMSGLGKCPPLVG